MKQSPEALAYLKARGIDHVEAIDTFRLGFANRTLGLRLPEKTRKAGADLRTRLQAVGIYRDSGHERYNGSVVVPVCDEARRITEVYGRKVTDHLRAGHAANTCICRRNAGPQAVGCGTSRRYRRARKSSCAKR